MIIKSQNSSLPSYFTASTITYALDMISIYLYEGDSR